MARLPQAPENGDNPGGVGWQDSGSVRSPGGSGSAVGARRQAGSALEIRDSGPGIEDDIVGRLGEPLVKGSASTGFGLGLSIVKRLCNRFDVVLSIGPLEDGGTRAEVRFPA